MTAQVVAGLFSQCRDHARPSWVGRTSPDIVYKRYGMAGPMSRHNIYLLVNADCDGSTLLAVIPQYIK